MGDRRAGARARDAVRSDPAAGGALLSLAGGEVERITAREVAVGAAAGDALSGRVLATAEAALGAGVATLVNALNPDLVVLGGGVVEGCDGMVERVAAIAHRRALPPPGRHVQIVSARLGAHAAVIGAAAWAREVSPDALPSISAGALPGP